MSSSHSHWFDNLAWRIATGPGRQAPTPAPARAPRDPNNARYTRRAALATAAGTGLLASRLNWALADSYCYSHCLDNAKQDYRLELKYACNGPLGSTGAGDPHDPATTGAWYQLSCTFTAWLNWRDNKANCAKPNCGNPTKYPPPGASTSPTGYSPVPTPPSSGSGCPDGTNACVPTADTCCYGSDVCCPCPSVAGGIICCVFTDCSCC